MVEINMMGGRIFKTMFAMLVIFALVFPLLNVYGYTAVKRKNHNATLTAGDPNPKSCPDHSYVEIIKPANNSIYIRDLRVPIPFLGKIMCDYVTKIANLTPIRVYAIAIGGKLTVKANVVLAENQTCKEVEFYRGTHLICADDEPPYECTFEIIDETTLYYITVTAVCTDFIDSPTIHVLVSPNLFTLFQDFLNLYRR